MRTYLTKRISLILSLCLLLFPGIWIPSHGQLKDPLHDQWKVLDDEFRSIIGPDEAGAAMLAMRKGKILFRSCYGLAAIDSGDAVEPNTRFRIGSLSKQFTAVAVMMLYEKDRLDIDLPVTCYLQECPSWYRGVTVRQLLNHTSGIFNFTEIPGIRSRYSNPVTKEELLGLIYDQPAVAEPGTAFHYSNSGYAILGKIVENLSGQHLRDFMEEELFAPAGMKNTIFWEPEHRIKGNAQGFEVRQGDTVAAPSLHHGWTFGGGGIASTVDDLALWMQALLEHRLISAHSLDMCFSRSNLKDGSRIDYGLGWYIDGEGDMKQVYHEGGVYGFVAYQTYLPSRDLFVIVLRNLIDFNTEYPAGRLASRMIYRLTDNTDPPAVTLAGSLDPYAGEYRITLNKSIRRIEVRDKELYYLSPPRDSTGQWRATLLLPASDSIFRVQESQSYFRFCFDEEKKPNGFVIVQPGGGREIQAWRTGSL